MMLELNERERDLLVRLLRADRAETSSEIHHAMDYQTRADLREERDVMMHLLEKLGATAATPR